MAIPTPREATLLSTLSNTTVGVRLVIALQNTPATFNQNKNYNVCKFFLMLLNYL